MNAAFLNQSLHQAATMTIETARAQISVLRAACPDPDASHPELAAQIRRQEESAFDQIHFASRIIYEWLSRKSMFHPNVLRLRRADIDGDIAGLLKQLEGKRLTDFIGPGPSAWHLGGITQTADDVLGDLVKSARLCRDLSLHQALTTTIDMAHAQIWTLRSACPKPYETHPPRLASKIMELEYGAFGQIYGALNVICDLVPKDSTFAANILNLTKDAAAASNPNKVVLRFFAGKHLHDWIGPDPASDSSRDFMRFSDECGDILLETALEFRDTYAEYAQKNPETLTREEILDLAGTYFFRNRGGYGADANEQADFLGFVGNVASSAEYRAEPLFFVEKWRNERGATAEFRFPEDLALQFFTSLVAG